VGRILIATWVLSAAATSFGQVYASIRAKVLDGQDEPVRGAIVEAMPTGGISGTIPWCKSDESGSCAISPGNLGSFTVTASKEEDGYPKQTMYFYAAVNSKPEIVILSHEQPAQSTLVHLGKKGGILIGTVADAKTGKPLNANAEFRWVSDPRIFLSGSGLTNARFRILVPPDVAVTMVVSLDGYENWSYSLGRGELRNAILLRPGEELALDVRLRPKGE
jgi:hypothetical protein